jgi:putative MFS transporter
MESNLDALCALPDIRPMKELKSVLNFTVIVAGLGYFVDLFDITLFGVVRTTSLHDLGVTDALPAGVLIYNAQMIGMMIGGLIWGTLGDKRGRLSVMMWSILLYSLSNIANAFTWDVPSYVVFRFLGGVGLAGELGAAITLVAESLPKEKRGLGTTIVAMLGMLGIVAAALLGQMIPWRWAYGAGGMLGFLLLAMRFKISESTLFEKPEAMENRGRISLLFKGERLKKYLCCIMIGIPVYFTTGVLFTFAPELTKNALGTGGVSAGNAILFGSIGLALGDLLSGLFSQRLRSRRLAIGSMLGAGTVMMWIYIAYAAVSRSGDTSPEVRAAVIYTICFFIGICVGYWAVLITMSAEQFGTNIRATVATTVPNFVRGSAIFAVSGTALLKFVLKDHFGEGAGTSFSALAVGTLCFGAAALCLFGMDETFSRDLDYVENV